MNIGRRGFAFRRRAFCLPRAAQEAWPTRPLTLVVPYPPAMPPTSAAASCSNHSRPKSGSGWSSTIAPALGIMGSASVARPCPTATPCFLTSNSPIASGPWVTKNVPYVVERDFTPIAGIARGALVLLAATGRSVSTTAEFVAYVKANPGKTATARSVRATSTT